MNSKTPRNHKANNAMAQSLIQTCATIGLIGFLTFPALSYEIPKEVLEARLQLSQLSLAYNSQVFIDSIGMEDKVAIKLFLIAGMNPNTQDQEGNTALMYAAKTGSLPVLQELLDAGADVNTRNKRQGTALQWAAAGEFTEAVAVLLDHGADAASRNEAFVYAASGTQIGMLQQIVKKGVDLKKFGGRALRSAASTSGGKKHIAMVKTLLDLGIDVNSKDAEGWTPLLNAANATFPSIIMARTLLDAGADVNSRCTCDGYRGGGFTALLLATMKGYDEIARLLIERGADVNAKTNRGMTPLMWIVDGSNAADKIELIKLLLKTGARKDEKDGEGRTALLIAEQRELDTIIPLLE